LVVDDMAMPDNITVSLPTILDKALNTAAKASE
jgi:hypothetical protein